MKDEELPNQNSITGSIEGVSSLTDYPDENVIRILITTDNHIGYNENDPIMGDDSWKTFAETLQIGTAHNVDFFLQSGDLFHVTAPSKKSLIRVSEALGKYCWGSKPVELQLLANPAKSLNNQNDHLNDVNWRNPNLNISFPVFAISGNHDDSTGRDQFSAMDILHTSGLVNHFGKTMTVTDIDIHPILLQKGSTKLALYGLNAIRDERLYKSFKMGKVNFNFPQTITNDEKKIDDDFFNLMCVHQNHTGHTNTGFLPEICLPNFLNLVIWGHEHESIPSIKHNSERDFDILQPGSSVATSLCEAECKPKHAFILEIDSNKNYKIVPIPLNTVRPFIMKDISLSDFKELEVHNKEQIQNFLLKTVNQLIEKANKESEARLIETTDIVDRKEILKLIPLPLIRLRVDYSCPTDPDVSYMVENTRRFSNRYVGKVANPNNIMQLYKKKKKPVGKTFAEDSLSGTKNKHGNYKEPEDDSSKFANTDEQILTIIEDNLKSTHLSLLSENGISEALRKTILNDDKSAMKSFLEEQVEKNTKLMLKNNLLLESHDLKDFKNILKKVTQPSNINPEHGQSGIGDVGLSAARNDLLEAASNMGNSKRNSRSSSADLPSARKRLSPEMKTSAGAITKVPTNGRYKQAVLENDGHQDEDGDFILSSDEDIVVPKSANPRTQVKPMTKSSLSTSDIDEKFQDIEVSSDDDLIASYKPKSQTQNTLQSLNDPVIIDSENEEIDDADFEEPQQKIPVKRKLASKGPPKPRKTTTKKSSIDIENYKPVTKLSQSSKLADMLNLRKSRK